MRLIHPRTLALRDARNRLLQQTLRDHRSRFPIAAEYPLVLGDQGDEYSYCLQDQECVVAHANLWPRRLVDLERTREHRIGLVGNVATDLARRGQGLMRGLMDELKAKAKADGLEALVLWSDLLEFYQKLGFQSYGREHRYLFKTETLLSLQSHAQTVNAWEEAGPLSTAELGTLLEKRLAVRVTLARSAEEFQTLRAIPHTDLFVMQGVPGSVSLTDRYAGYAIMGKGMDMVNVVHEWGAPSATALLEGLAVAATARRFDDVMLLTPDALPAGWHDVLSQIADSVEAHPMALVWSPEGNDAARDALARGFIWGLDSI